MRSIKEIEIESKKVTEDLYRKAFAMGVSLHYVDDRTKGSDYYIQANPDGLEDLVSFDINTKKYIVIKNLEKAGEGYWAYLLN